MRINIEIPTDPDVCDVHTRNGNPDLAELRVWDAAGTAVHVVYIEGVNRRGNVLKKSGFRLEASNLDELCYQWLVARFGSVADAQNFLADRLLRRDNKEHEG